MRLAHVETLVRLEVRRVGFLLGRMYLAGAALLVLFMVLGRASGGNVIAVVAGGTLGTALLIPFTVTRDKGEYTMDFLLSMPVKVSVLIAARFVAAALVVLPGALATGVSVAFLELPRELVLLEGFAVVNFVLGFWVLLTVAAWWLTAAAAAFDSTTAIMWPLGVVALMTLALPEAARVLGDDVTAAVLWLFGLPYAVAVISALVAGIMVVAAVAAFGVAHRGFARYSPRPERRM